jgi:hypothetical protein
MQKFRRKKKLIKPALQIKGAVAFLCTAGIGVLVQAMILVHALANVAGQVPNDRLVILDAVPKVLATNLVITFVFLVPLTLSIGILVTFRVAGPIYRFEHFLNQVLRGERPGPCRIRKGDELQDFCELLNRVTAPLREGQTESETASEAERTTHRAA